MTTPEYREIKEVDIKVDINNRDGVLTTQDLEEARQKLHAAIDKAIDEALAGAPSVNTADAAASTTSRRITRKEARKLARR